jgi:hypothetical protein
MQKSQDHGELAELLPKKPKTSKDGEAKGDEEILERPCERRRRFRAPRNCLIYQIRQDDGESSTIARGKLSVLQKMASYSRRGYEAL